MGEDRLVKPLYLDRRLFDSIELPAHMGERVMADAQRSRRSGLLHARGDVDADAADVVAVVNTGTQQYRSCADADAHAEPGYAMVRLEPWRQRARLLDQGQATPHCPLGVVLPDAMGAEQREHAVPGIAQHAAFILFDDAAELPECFMKYRAHVFGIKTSGNLGRPHDIEEEHRHHAQRFVATGWCIERVQTLAKRRQCHVDDGISKKRALRLESRNRGLDIGANGSHLAWLRRRTGTCASPEAVGLAAASRKMLDPEVSTRKQPGGPWAGTSARSAYASGGRERPVRDARSGIYVVALESAA